MTWTDLHNRAYVPYSKQPRSCIVKGSGGNYYTGVRIENASFPLTIGAVQAASCICLSEGETPKTIILPDTEYDQLEFWKNEFNCELLIQEDISGFSIKPLKISQPLEEHALLVSLLGKAVTGNSDFPVSAILFTEGGYFEGVNIEVSDWALGLCAERVALAKAFAEGVHALESIAVHTLKGEFSSPCGACRQVLNEHIPLKKVKMHHADHTYSEHFVLDLLPFSFTSKDLRG